METTSTYATTTSPRREVIYRGQLQQKLHKKFGTLLRKKKCFYEDELWVVLCVHDGGSGGIPHLEWYGEPRSISEHQPLKVQDLLDCQYVNVAIGEERCLVIGFTDKNRPILELSAPSIEERQQWVDVLTRTLHRLNCLIVEEAGEEDGGIGGGGGGARCPRAENEYISIAENDPSPPRYAADQFSDHEQAQHLLIPSPPSTSAQIRSQIQAGGAGDVTPTTSRRVGSRLKDTIPMLQHWPSTSQSPTYLSHNGKTGEDDETGIASYPTPLPRQKHSPKQIIPSPSKLEESLDASGKIGKENVESDRNNAQEHSEKDRDDEPNTPPPLPPRNVKSPPPPSMMISISPKMPTSPIPSSPPQKLQSQYNVLNQSTTLTARSQSQYDQLCTTNNKSRPSSESYSDRISSSKSSCSSSSARNSIRRQSVDDPPQHVPNSAQYDVLCPSVSLPTSNYDALPAPPNFTMPLPQSSALMQSPTEHIFRESLCRPRRISFSFALLADHVAFVELAGKVWVAGWSPSVDAHLRDILSFGDEVECMNSTKLRSVQQLPEIYAKIKPGVQIELVLRSNPAMKIFTLLKPANPKRELGIVLHRGKNKIASIERRSPAESANLSATMPAYFFQPAIGANNSSMNDRDKQQQVKAVITQLNGIPMNPFGRNDQFFHRLDKLPTGQPFNVSIHPADFCSLLLRNMKSQLRGWRKFVHNDA